MSTLGEAVLAAIVRVQMQSREERGASLLEYALLVSLIAVVCIASVSFFGVSISYQASEFASAIDN